MRDVLDILDDYIRHDMKVDTPTQEFRHSMATALKDALYEIVINEEEENKQ